MSNGSTALDLTRLRSELEARFGRAVLPAPSTPAGPCTGIPAVDALLPGGVPRGALSLWTGAGTSGRTAALRALAHHATARGVRTVVVDAGASLDPVDWCAPAEAPERVWVARPPEGRRQEGAWAAEALLRAGVFELVILDGALLDAVQAHRLRAMARERGAALVVSTEAAPSGWRPDLRLEFRARDEAPGLGRGGRYRRRVEVRAERGGPTRPARELEITHAPPDVLGSPDPTPDRRVPPRRG
jgi:hypothetical protein